VASSKGPDGEASGHLPEEDAPAEQTLRRLYVRSMSEGMLDCYCCSVVGEARRTVASWMRSRRRVAAAAAAAAALPWTSDLSDAPLEDRFRRIRACCS